MSLTNKGIYRILGNYFRGESKPTNLYLALVTSAVEPTVDTNTFGELTEIAAGNGYTAGGYQLNFNSTDWDTWIEDDVNDKAYVALKDLVWTGTGGPIPASGNGARYAVLTDDNATPANREVYGWFDLVTARQVSDEQTLTLQDCKVEGLQAA